MIDADREVVEAVAVAVVDRDGLTETVVAEGARLNVRRVLVDRLRPGDDDAGVAAVEDPDATGVAVAVDAFGGGADHELVEAIAVEIAGREHLAPAVLGRTGAGDAREVLVEKEPARLECGVAVGGAIADLDRTGVGHAVDVFAGSADREVVEAVLVEVADGEGGAEAVAVFGIVDRAHSPLPEILDERPGFEPDAGDAPADLHLTDLVLREELLIVPVDPDRQIQDAVAVEVAGDQGVARELLRDARRMQRVAAVLVDELGAGRREPDGGARWGSRAAARRGRQGPAEGHSGTAGHGGCAPCGETIRAGSWQVSLSGSTLQAEEGAETGHGAPGRLAERAGGFRPCRRRGPPGRRAGP